MFNWIWSQSWGNSWAEPNLGRFSEIYNSEGNKYWVIVDKNNKIVGGTGIGRLEGIEDVCELQKMYCLPSARGTGISHKLMNIALEYAKKYYKRCYIETLENMIAAQKFYKKYGFKRIYEPLVKTEHYCCDVRFVKDLIWTYNYILYLEFEHLIRYIIYEII